jgi:hypothetical protein
MGFGSVFGAAVRDVRQRSGEVLRLAVAWLVCFRVSNWDRSIELSILLRSISCDEHTYPVLCCTASGLVIVKPLYEVLSKLARSADRSRICCGLSLSTTIMGPPQLGHDQSAGELAATGVGECGLGVSASS